MADLRRAAAHRRDRDLYRLADRACLAVEGDPHRARAPRHNAAAHFRRGVGHRRPLAEPDRAHRGAVRNRRAYFRCWYLRRSGKRHGEDRCRRVPRRPNIKRTDQPRCGGGPTQPYGDEGICRSGRIRACARPDADPDHQRPERAGLHGRGEPRCCGGHHYDSG